MTIIHNSYKIQPQVFAQNSHSDSQNCSRFVFGRSQMLDSFEMFKHLNGAGPLTGSQFSSAVAALVGLPVAANEVHREF